MDIGRIVRLAVALLLAYTIEASAAISNPVVIGTNSDNASSSSLSVTVPVAGVPKNDLVVVVCAVLTTAGAVSVSDSRTNTYTVRTDINGNNGRLYIAEAVATTALVQNDTITCTYPTSSGIHLIVANDIAGITTSSPFDVASSNSGNDASPTSLNTANTAQADELVIGGVAWNGTATFSTGAGLTLTGTVSAGTGASTKSLDCEYKIVAVTGAYKIDGSLSAGAFWRAGVATYKASAAAAAVPMRTLLGVGI